MDDGTGKGGTEEARGCAQEDDDDDIGNESTSSPPPRKRRRGEIIDDSRTRTRTRTMTTTTEVEGGVSNDASEMETTIGPSSPPPQSEEEEEEKRDREEEEREEKEEEDEVWEEEMNDEKKEGGGGEDLPLRRLIPPTHNPDDWSAVIARASSHPHEASESYFDDLPGQPSSSSSSLSSSSTGDGYGEMTKITNVAGWEGEYEVGNDEQQPVRCRPLHAMLLYDPPPDAVEAVLRAYPEAVLDAATFDGATALRIAAERSSECERSHRSHSSYGVGGVDVAISPSSQRVMRLLLVAELAMARSMGEMEEERLVRSRRIRRRVGGGVDQIASSSPSSGDGEVVNATGGESEYDDDDDDEDALSQPFFGHNPIVWTTEPSVPVVTAAMLLKWYPFGAFQRRGIIDKGEGGDDDAIRTEEGDADSPLIRIIDDFARDNCGVITGYASDDDDDADGNGDEVRGLGDGDGDGVNSDDYSGSGLSMVSADRIASKLYQRRELRRREGRWEKFLHILYATDTTLKSRRKPPPYDDDDATLEEDGGAITKDAANLKDSAVPAASDVVCRAGSATSTVPDNATTGGPSTSVVPGQSLTMNNNDPAGASSHTATTESTIQTGSMAANAANGIKKPSVTPFHPVHAWLRCLASPNLGLEHCQAYGAWSVLREMKRRIPNEFMVRDSTDGNRTAFQTLAESKAKDCKLCPAEIRDIVECLMDTNHRSAFLPRKSDGRLIGHVAIENGWPCKDLFSSKTSAPCA